LNFRILYQDQHIVAIDKPAGFHVHPPEDFRHKISNQTNCLYLLRRQLDTYLYPVHRLDRATSGVLLFALHPEAAKQVCELFSNNQIVKTYYTVTRGWLPREGMVDHALKSEQPTDDQRLQSLTSFHSISHLELPFATGRYPSSRYTLVRALPKTGRRHQIRRHFVHLSHPLIGDTVYGDTLHNHYFRNHLNIQGLLLKAYSLELIHPYFKQKIVITTRWNGLWHRVFDLFGVCPYSSAL
jgi:tRNA pseudouridine65 synthase